MKNLYKKVSVIALVSMIISGGIVSSGVNAQAYSPSELKKQIEDLGKGASVYHEVKYIAEKSGAKVESAFSSKVGMNRYVEKNYWDKIQGQSKSAKKERKALLEGVECGSDPRYLEMKIKEHSLGNLFRVRYKRYYFLIRIVKYKKISDIPEISSAEIEKNLSRENQRLYYNHLRGIVRGSGYRVVMAYDENRINRKRMNEYIEDRLKEEVFKGSEEFREHLLLGLHCSDIEAFKHNLQYRYKGNIMRLIYDGIDMLVVRDN